MGIDAYLDSNQKLKDMLIEFQMDGKFYQYLMEDGQGAQAISFDGFRAFLQDYFGAESLGGKLEKFAIGHDNGPLDKIPEEEADTPENKLEVVFHVYDSDGNGFLDKAEIDSIIEQMMNVARYQQWDTIELEQILRQMMADIDYDNDGIVSLEEWRRGGLTNIPLLVLLGFDTMVLTFGDYDTSVNPHIVMLVAAYWLDGEANKDLAVRVHHRCMAALPQECNMGPLAYHILPPTHIFPAFLERKSSFMRNHSHGSNLLQVGYIILYHVVLSHIHPYFSDYYNILRLHLFSAIHNCNVLVCGGDGTIGWVLESMDKMENLFPHGRPPVAVLPLGTGNDLARCLRWGGGYENESLHKILQQIEKATLIEVDRWQIRIIPKEDLKKKEKGDPQPYNIINNYFSIGVRFRYFELGTSETLSSSCKNLHEQIDIHCDGETIDLGQDASLEGIALLNIHSIYGGSNLWGRSRKGKGRITFPHMSSGQEKMQLQTRVQDIGDGLIEMGQIKAGVRGARRLSQCATVVIDYFVLFFFPMNDNEKETTRNEDGTSKHSEELPAEEKVSYIKQYNYRNGYDLSIDKSLLYNQTLINIYLLNQYYFLFN
uniref:Diacylglycerol kinase n=1 Tax=Heterorhabditis bacteriophora TaxID=37862 RepID=A0A1I7WZ50_HETBA